MSLTLEKVRESKLFIWLEGGTTEDNRPDCENVFSPCTRQAVWKMIQPCCGKVTLLCDPHKREEIRHQERLLAGGPVVCTTCSAPMHEKTRWEPLHG